MVFDGQAKKVAIRLRNGDADLSGPICRALLTFLSPKDVCCLQVFQLAGEVEIRFLARPCKAESLIDTAALIAPGALIHVEDTTIVRAPLQRSRTDPSSGASGFGRGHRG
jgi:hypothetical protein